MGTATHSDLEQLRTVIFQGMESSVGRAVAPLDARLGKIEARLFIDNGSPSLQVGGDLTLLDNAYLQVHGGIATVGTPGAYVEVGGESDACRSSDCWAAVGKGFPEGC